MPIMAAIFPAGNLVHLLKLYKVCRCEKLCNFVLCNSRFFLAFGVKYLSLPSYFYKISMTIVRKVLFDLNYG